jgi:hypothetical protein
MARPSPSRRPAAGASAEETNPHSIIVTAASEPRQTKWRHEPTSDLATRWVRDRAEVGPSSDRFASVVVLVGPPRVALMRWHTPGGTIAAPVSVVEEKRSSRAREVQ